MESKEPRQGLTTDNSMVYGVRMTLASVAKLEAIAAAQDKQRSTLTREIVEAYLAQQEQAAQQTSGGAA